MPEKQNIAIIGSPDTVIGFAALGLKTFGVTSKEETLKALDEIDNGDYAIIFITERWSVIVPERIAEMRDQTLPAIITVPSPKGATGAGLADLRVIVEKAVGSDILFSDK